MRYEADALQQWTEAILDRCGVPFEGAQTTARVLIRTSLRGIDTHGIARLPAYVGFLQDGTYNPRAEPVLTQRHGSLNCDADFGLGQFVLAKALDAALAVARTQAIVGCTIVRCGHLGALGTIVLEAAERGMVALLCQRTPPIMAMPGFAGRAIGNNPLAFAMPIKDGAPLVFDMALSAVARGNVANAARDGHASIPPGWAVDESGQPTTDTQAALRGAMLPIADHKGLGLAMMVQCFAGSLGALEQSSDQSAAGGERGTSAFLLVANPDLLTGRDAFDENVTGWLSTYRNAAGEAGRYPGERQGRFEIDRSSAGIPLSPGLQSELRQLGDRLGTPLTPSL